MSMKDNREAWDEWHDDLTWQQLHAKTPKQGALGTCLLIMAYVVVIGVLLSLLAHQQYDTGYVNGSRDGAGVGYINGLTQGTTMMDMQLMQWEHDHKCATDAQGYVRLKVLAGKSGYQYACAGEKQ